jgi:hypothetical protein
MSTTVALAGHSWCQVSSRWLRAAAAQKLIALRRGHDGGNHIPDSVPLRG